jgi:GH24 family phage-related lysozyme (muramidase)
MEDNTIKDLVSDMLSNIVLGDKPEEEQVKSTGLMSSLPGVRTPTQTQQQEQEAAPKARDKVKEFILRLSDEAEDTNSLRYSEKAAPEITDVMVDSETLLNRYATPLYVYARNLRDYNPERSTIKVRNRGDHSERFLDQMYELARQSSEEAALARMEMGITESLPRSAPRMGFDVQGLIDAVNRENALRAGTKPLPSIPEVETEELDDEEVAILSDTDIDTDDADGGAAPSDGKGLMSPSESLRPRARPEEELLSIPSNIDMSFLGAKEGFELDAYIPKDKKGNPIDNSGVTIGTGVDLGGKNEKYFEGLDPSILSKLKPHLGKKRKDAQKSLEENPFSLTKDEAITLDTFVKAKEFDVLRKRWNKDSKIDWDDLPSNQATVVASVYYQHGNQMFGYNFWKQTTSGDWNAAHNNLMTWGGSTPSRRRDEAKLLKADT